MSRNTYHHLKEDELVPLEHYQWNLEGNLEILEEVEGRVMGVFSRRVAIKFEMRVWVNGVPWQDQESFETIQLFSRRGGQRWGAGSDDYRIRPDQAQRKT
jgi:hypothetical protein